MAVLASIATGNFTAAATWGLVDSTSYLNAENATESLLTTVYSGTRSQSFTPGAIVVSHIGVKLCERLGTTGTMSVHLATSADHVEVAGTAVTINTADLPSALEADLNGGWIFFKLATPVTLSAATGYEVEALTSSANMVDLWCDATVDNVSRALVTTTTQAPAAGDDLIVAGERTGAGTGNSFTVTMNETATTDYGAASTSLVTPSLAICDRGTLQYGTTAATNYYLRQSGNVIVYSGGILNIGTTGTPIPRDSTAKLNFDCGANVDFGLTVRNLGTFNSQGLSRTSGKNIVSCKLNTDEAAAQTVLGVDTDTGWLSGDVIAIASTTRTASQCESATLSGNATATEITVSAGITNAHSGTSPTQAEVILLTRNVSIFGASASLQAYIQIKATAIVDIDWTEIYWMGTGIDTLKKGLQVATTTGSFNMQYSSSHDFIVTGSTGFEFPGQSGNGFTYSNNVTYLIAGTHFSVAATPITWTADSNIFMRNTDGVTIFSVTDVGGTITNNIVVGCASTGVATSFSEAGQVGTINNLISHSNAGIGIGLTNIINSSVSNITSWRNNSSSSASGIRLGNLVDTSLNTVTLFGNNTGSIDLQNSLGNIKIIDLLSNGDTTFSTTNGFSFSSASSQIFKLFLYNADLSSVSGIKTAHTNDINISSSNFHSEIIFNSSKLGGTNEIASQTNLSNESFISSQKHDQTAGLHKTWKKYGTITIETTTVHTGSQSVKMTPNNASGKLESGSFKIAVANGGTLTPSVYVREDASYNGARARLILKRNDAIGITSDTVIDTATAASDEAWEQLTGTTAAATDDGVMEFVIDCDGTAGNLFCDSFTTT